MRYEFLDFPTRKRNRLMSHRPKGGLFWCWKCDRQIVGMGEKCPVCGVLNGEKRFKRKELY